MSAATSGILRAKAPRISLRSSRLHLPYFRAAILERRAPPPYGRARLQSLVRSTLAPLEPTMTLRTAAAALLFALAVPNIALAVGVGGTCGGVAGITCDSGLWCEGRANQCGVADAQGTCVRVPEACAMNHAPVCGCNGQTFSNDCQRRSARVSRASDGACRDTRQPPR